MPRVRLPLTEDEKTKIWELANREQQSFAEVCAALVREGLYGRQAIRDPR